MENRKGEFLNGEFLTMSINGALGRSKTYSESAEVADKEQLRRSLRKVLATMASMYKTTVDETEHIANIRRIADECTSRFGHCLRGKRFRIGIAQKALNLYLKYLWCVGVIPTPPHCPFDRRVINRLPLALIWTELDDIGEYLALVQAAKKKAGEQSLSEWELEEWEKSR